MSRPEALRRWQMVEEVSRNASAVAHEYGNPAKKIANGNAEVHQPASGLTHATDAAASARAASTSAGQAASSASQRLPAQNGIDKRPVKQQKCCCCRVIKSAAATSASAAKRRRNECRSITKSAATSASSDHEGVRSCHTSAQGAAAKRQRNLQKRMHQKCQ